MRTHVAFLALFTAAQPSAAGGARLGPLSVVIESELGRRALGYHEVVFDDFLGIDRETANRVRRSVVPYLHSKWRKAGRATRPYYGGILATINDYRWHCAGHTYRKEKRMFCVAFHSEIDESLVANQVDAANGLPSILDGGIGMLSVLFSLADGKVLELRWNSEA